MRNMCFLIGVVIVLVLGVAGCASTTTQNQLDVAPSNASTPRTEADYRGTITKITPSQSSEADERLATFLVENLKRLNARYDHDKIIVWVTKKTQIFEQNGDNRSPALLDKLVEGDEVEFRTTDATMTSMPPQMIAVEIVILKKSK